MLLCFGLQGHCTYPFTFWPFDTLEHQMSIKLPLKTHKKCIAHYFYFPISIDKKCRAALGNFWAFFKIETIYYHHLPSTYLVFICVSYHPHVHSSLFHTKALGGLLSNVSYIFDCWIVILHVVLLRDEAYGILMNMVNCNQTPVSV